jgi:hypothetical protein
MDKNTEEKKEQAFEIFKSAFENIDMCTSLDYEINILSNKISTTLNIEMKKVG